MKSGAGAKSKILIGTASWTDKTLIRDGDFYPPGATTAEARLRFYAEQFSIVEVDSTYYFPPTGNNIGVWMERTPAHFTFHIKAYSLFTGHPTKRESLYQQVKEMVPREHAAKKRLYAKHLPAEAMDRCWNLFSESLMPLHSSGKLGVVHFQFPEWFMPGAQSRDYITECSERLRDYEIAVEFRNALWFNERNLERTVDFLSSRQIPLTSVDMPQGFRSSLPPVALATSKKLAYVRFHGRNSAEWDKPHATATPRFAYNYSEEELSEWVPRLTALAKRTRRVHVLMNNCYRDYAVKNARQLGSLIAG